MGASYVQREIPQARLGLTNERPAHRAGPAFLCRGRTRPGFLRIPGSFDRSIGKTDLPSGAVFMNHESRTYHAANMAANNAGVRCS